MTDVLLPDVAAAMLAARYPTWSVAVVTRPRASAAHLVVSASFTATGALRRRGFTSLLLCGTRGRRWYRAEPDGRPLCLRCRRSVTSRPGLTERAAAPMVPIDRIVAILATARTAPQVSAATRLACDAGVIGKTVETADGRRRVSELVQQARRRVAAGPRLTERDHALGSRLKNAPGSRYPRRSR